MDNLCCDCKEPLTDGFIHRCPKCWDEIYFPGMNNGKKYFLK